MDQNDKSEIAEQLLKLIDHQIVISLTVDEVGV